MGELLLVADGAASFSAFRFDAYATREDRASTYDGADHLMGA